MNLTELAAEAARADPDITIAAHPCRDSRGDVVCHTALVSATCDGLTFTLSSAEPIEVLDVGVLDILIRRARRGAVQHAAASLGGIEP